jgi:hypothetical protein
VDVDFSRAWLDLKAELVKKGSHGARDLALLMAELEVKHTIPEDQAGYSDRPTPLRSRRTRGKDDDATNPQSTVAGDA